jgi:outer membrane translocation and assembly module TamA
LFKINAQLTTRLQESFINNQVSVSTGLVLPSLGHFGRFVLAATYANTWDNINNTFFSLGGEAGLRGAAYRYYQGRQLLRTNVEFRTRSVPFWIFRFGLAAFYDFGDAFNSSKDFNPTHDLGLGLRILTVPWNRLLIRVDAATPVWGPVHGFSNTLITLGIGQAF